ncbi:MAG: HD domain-containing protein [Oscillospiraceae bacterium]|nr:HD domain-containing protein [Oscillospiraceae bacterium]
MKICDIIDSAVSYDRGDPKRINHFMKVYAYAHLIGIREGLEQREQDILEAAAVLHDIGIHNAEMLHGSSDGKYQELEGPAIAADILSALGADEDFIQRVCNMVGRHHTYHGIYSQGLQILIEADFLVNFYEDDMEDSAVASVKSRIFKTTEGIRLLEQLYEEKYTSLG